jgi:tripartite-type tricarboxylate transporter receptor subunit TctC
MNQTQFTHRRSLTKWIFAFVTAHLMGAALAQSSTPNFPTKPVRIIVPQTPGGASDALRASLAKSFLKDGVNPL